MLVKTAFVFLDPPYSGESVYIEQESPSIGWFCELISILDGPEVEARWLMTLSLDDPEVRELIPERWHRLRFDGATYRVGVWSGGAKRKESNEYLLSNRPLVPQVYRGQAKLF
jgi:hypothetical protein